jgi:membrane protein YqaA with SNARE-associated domain
MINAVLSSIFLIKQEQQQLLAQLIDAVSDFINNPLFAEFGPIGLFVNGVFSPFIPFPPELTAISLILAGISRIDVLAILVTSWIIGAAVGYYAGLYGKKLVASFRSKREQAETTRKEEEDDDDDNNNALLAYTQKSQKDRKNASSRHDKDKEENKNSRYRRLLEKYGWVIIFVSPWIPILGDIISLIAGAKRYEIKRFMIAIAAGKIVRAVAVVFLGNILASITTPPWI